MGSQRHALSVVALTIGCALSASGFTEVQIKRNPGGVAVSGEVYAEYWHPDLDHWLYVCLVSSVLRGLVDRPRDDGLVLMARTRVNHNKRVVDGANHYLSPSKDSVSLAQDLLTVIMPPPCQNNAVA